MDAPRFPCPITSEFWYDRVPVELEIQGVRHPAHQWLREVARMVRGGLAHDATAGDLHNRLATTIERLKQEARTSPVFFDQVQIIKLKTLEAEFFYQNGRFNDAVQTLEPLWRELKQGLEKRSTYQGLKPGKNRPLLRQKIWAMLHYVFYDLYTNDKYKQAINQFNRIELIIRRNLASPATSRSPEYIPFGTLAIFHYFIGQCYRGLRQFGTAEIHFLEAQSAAQHRIEKKLALSADKGRTPESKLSPEDCAYALAYHTVFTARVLAIGLGWVAIQQGHLLRAEHLMRAGLAVLTGIRQESHKLIIESLLYMAMRRRAAFESGEYQAAMEGLKDCFDRFSKIRDVPGQFRCASELVRGHLDRAEFIKPEKETHLHEAQKRLQFLAKIHRDRNAVRYHMLASRFFLLSGNLEQAAAAVSNAKKIVEDPGKSDIKLHHEMDLAIVDAAVTFARKATSSAENKTEYALHKLKARSFPDPVLEADGYVLRAQVAKKQDDLETARLYLDKWDALSQFVENYYLHRLASTLRDEMQQPPFTLNFEFDLDTKTIPYYELEFRAWLDRVVKKRFPAASIRRRAKLYGVNASTMLRRDNKARKTRRQA
jgi:tetratricopeptide (TPR) repeat protein